MTAQIGRDDAEARELFLRELPEAAAERRDAVQADDERAAAPLAEVEPHAG